MIRIIVTKLVTFINLKIRYFGKYIKKSIYSVSKFLIINKKFCKSWIVKMIGDLKDQIL